MATKLWIVPILLVIGIFLVSGCYRTETIQFQTTPNIQKSCADNAKTLFPTNITLYFTESLDTWNFIPPYAHTNRQNNVYKWNDGTNFNPTSGGLEGNYFSQGSESGQNINFYYICNKNLLPTSCNIEYSKQIISPNGTILGNRAFEAQPILKMINGTQGKITIGDVQPEE